MNLFDFYWDPHLHFDNLSYKGNCNWEQIDFYQNIATIDTLLTQPNLTLLVILTVWCREVTTEQIQSGWSTAFVQNYEQQRIDKWVHKCYMEGHLRGVFNKRWTKK